jgi:nucleoside-diphosphate-sugar epimerase
VKEAVSGIEVIFHEAAFVSVPQSMDEPQECFDVNLTGTSLLFDAARRAGVRRAVVASSAAVYGESEALPLIEETPLMPKSPYAVSKRVNEMYAELFTNSSGFEVSRCVTSTCMDRVNDRLDVCAAVPILRASVGWQTHHRVWRWRADP